jgi:hypothetical protein
MLWNKARRSSNVNDTREGKDARTPTGKALTAGLAALTLAGIGIYSTLGTTPEQGKTVTEDPYRQFVESILGDTEDTWKQLFTQTGRQYTAPTLTLYSDGVSSGCGYAGAGSGPFYCPDNRQLYLDPEFFAQMARRFSLVGDFAQAYVIAHEVGHHVQLELGLSSPFDRALAARDRVVGDGGLEVRAELQADCLAGVWAHHAQQRLDWLEPGDIEEALNAAKVFGDDYLQTAQQQTVRPDTFSHGSSQQRTRWFTAGFDSGRIDTCDTFAATAL